MLARAHTARAGILIYDVLDPAGGLAELNKARQLTPGSANIEALYASAEMALGHADLAAQAARRAAELDPLGVVNWIELANALFEGHRYDEALSAVEHARAATGSLPLSLAATQALILLMQGHPDSAHVIVATGNSWQENWVLAMADHALGHQTAAEADLAKVHAALGDGGAYNYAEIYAQWGDKAEALHWLEIAVQLRDPGLVAVVLDPLLDPIRGEARFKDVQTQLASAAGP
jgi:tetratricopeptide (TPR) repeat protein